MVSRCVVEGVETEMEEEKKRMGDEEEGKGGDENTLKDSGEERRESEGGNEEESGVGTSAERGKETGRGGDDGGDKEEAKNGEEEEEETVVTATEGETDQGEDEGDGGGGDGAQGEKVYEENTAENDGPKVEETASIEATLVVDDAVEQRIDERKENDVVDDGTRVAEEESVLPEQSAVEETEIGETQTTILAQDAETETSRNDDTVMEPEDQNGMEDDVDVAATSAEDEVEVELCVLPEKYIHRQRWPVSTPASSILDDVSSLLGLPRESLSLFTLEPRTPIAASTILASLPASPKHGGLSASSGKGTGSGAANKLRLELDVDTVKPLHLLRRQGAGDDAILTGRLRVEVDMGSESRPKHVVVLVEREPGPKAYLGGFRSKRTGAVFHNAESQTDEGMFRDRAPKPSTATQTCVMTPAGVQTGREQGTQMPRVDLLIDTSCDVQLSPRPYVTSEEHLQRKLASVIVIQCHARGYLARKLARRLRRERTEAMLAADEEVQLRAYELEKARRYEIERRMHPSTKEDFAILRRELKAWKEQELAGIRSQGVDDTETHRQMLALLHKETKLLQTIDRLKNHAAGDTKDVRTAAMLGEMAAAKGWSLRDGDTIDVHTPFTVRARELMQLYNALRLPLLTLDERLDVLLHVKWTVKEFDCNLTREIVSLVDREADLLNRGRDVQKLANLRKRTANLFLEFIETPEFNPESARFRLVA